jgi:xylan 1,4-beta-xylosidase
MNMSASRISSVGLRWGLAAVALITLSPSVQAQQASSVEEVKAPGSQTPGAPLPRYVYNVVAADFAKPEGHPLLKSKFNLYDPVGPTMAQFDAAIDLMGELKVDTYRIELAWGRPRSGFGTHTGVGGTPGNVTYDFSALDHMRSLLKSQDVTLLASYSYTPPPLQDMALAERYGPKDGMLRGTTPPKDPAQFAEAAAAFAAHARDVGTPMGVHEVWNEPDGTYQFYSGTPEQYQALYGATVKRIRRDDPLAVVAGPASDHHMLWSQSFIDYVAQNKLPLDYYTFHEYGSGELAERQVDRATASLNRYPSLVRTGLSLDEWHDGECCTWCADDNRNHYPAAPELLHDFALLLRKPELTSVSWAWWLDPKRPGNGCMGLITSEGKRKAVFNAWKLYAMMPIDRRAVRLEGPLEAMASSDAHKSSLLIWNRGAYDRRLDVYLDNLPFKRGTVRIYRVDGTHASAGDSESDALTVTETYQVNDKSWRWVDGVIPRSGVLYVEASDDVVVPEGKANVAEVVRIDRYFPQRGKTAAYADFDRRNWVARLGMMGSTLADQEIGVVARGLPDTLSVQVDIDGQLRKTSANSLLGVRVDYMAGDKFVKSVLYHGPVAGTDLFSPGRTAVMPFGTERKADTVTRVANFAKFQLPLKAAAPAGWAGRASLTFILQDAGPDARAKITIRQ